MTDLLPSDSNNRLNIFFHGTGSGGHLALGSSAATVEQNGQPLLLIDCGPGTLASFQQRYQCLPPALFISHAHMDHIADLEILTVRARLAGLAPIPLFAPLSIITTLHQRLATYPGSMAEGDHNFWQSFQLQPVTQEFIWQQRQWLVHATRHHAPNSSFALQLPGIMFYSGDTRPIPEILSHCLQGDERLFHDCGLVANPSHTGLDDLAREYSASLRQRFVLYHYADQAAGDQLQQAGYSVARPGDCFMLGTASA
ncbi:MBL fold metallo-hydrolase [Bacterioplanes sanyensis]|uniref:MBL fold metallo-hydrolase n=1 Tax=Bacterioplanes sanyensis TaxID=1249553 RepID=A0A222FKK4_9GAMM|nr:MBL fold metallo-hydrolase [Bacterioplanes sanyensis]ASP39310.1 MBL fold metallo-hydrolase [Bacterioplanes sanyensis]